jgi:hypothetical protein
MPYNMPDAKLDVLTKYGTITLTFIDPDAEAKDSRGQPTRENERTIGRVTGDVVINRIPVRVDCRICYATEHYAKGKELETPVRVMRRMYSAYDGTKRTDKGYFGSSDIPPGVRKTLDTLIGADIRTAYEAHPELQCEARRARLAYAVDRAESERDEAYAKYDAAEKALLSARRTFADFNDANPIYSPELCRRCNERPVQNNGMNCCDSCAQG